MEMQTFIRLIADGTLVPVVLIGIYALLFKVPSSHRYAAYCRILMAGLTTYLVAKYMATLYQPVGERPFELLGVAPGAAYLNNPGFPSDHALFSASILFAVWFETKSKLLSGILVVLVVLVCVGRVLALVHTPLDILGGLIAATVGASWYLTPQFVQNRPVHRKHTG
jgi:membrane-associated phospholipid phosphatase